jgi:phage shock protein PspC (stress-responsive transcriptional regulator)
VTVGPRVRRLLLALHLSCSVGWIGAVCAYLALAFAVPATDDPEVVRAAWIGMELVGWYAIVPLALGSLATGVLMGAATKWGLLRHYWVLISLAGTVVLTAVLIMHMPDVTAQADRARTLGEEEGLLTMGSDIAHAVIGLVMLLGILVLNIYKPRGLTKYGWRKEQAARSRGAATRASA